MLAVIDRAVVDARASECECGWNDRYAEHVAYLRRRLAEQGPPAQRVIEQHQLELIELEAKYRRVRAVACAGVTGTVSLLLWILLGLPIP